MTDLAMVADTSLRKFGSFAGEAPLAEMLASEIQAMILSGALRPGQKVNQANLARALGYSRTPVREALQILHAQGLVIFSPNKGATVRRLTRRECAENYLVRAELEGIAAELAARSISSSEIAELESLNVELTRDGAALVRERLSPAQTQAMRDEWLDGNDRFHDILITASRCQQLEECIRFVLSKLPRSLTWLAIEGERGTLESYAEEHRRIIEALAAGDSRRARRAAKAHVMHARELMLMFFDSRLD
jgi:DNA-binding GntR family transcriptional regulator